MGSQEQTYIKRVIAHLLEVKARLEKQIADLEERISYLEERVARLEEQVIRLEAWVARLKEAQALTEKRLNRLEQESAAAMGFQVEKTPDRSGRFLRHPRAILPIIEDDQKKPLDLTIFQDLWN